MPVQVVGPGGVGFFSLMTAPTITTASLPGGAYKYALHHNNPRRRRRYAIIIFFIVGALLTPPDVASQVALALVLTGLYELSILLITLTSQPPEVKHERKI